MTTAWQEEPARERIISAAPGVEAYRQIHLAEHNPGRWQATWGGDVIPVDRRDASPSDRRLLPS